MNKINKIFDFFFCIFLSDTTKEKIEKITVYTAIVSFLLHLLAIFLTNINVLNLIDHNKLLTSPIAALYTPFSVVIIYEVYLLLFYLPKSTSIYIGKQYEIISLIVIRRIFKDLSNIEITPEWFSVKYDLLFTYDLVGILLIFWLIYIFNKLVKSNAIQNNTKMNDDLAGFIKLKQKIATALVPVLIVLSLYNFSNWLFGKFFSLSNLFSEIKDINKIFFDDFFTFLILVDVLLLIYSFLYSDKFNKVIRNSGFIISTVLIKLSFSTSGLINIVLIVIALLFGVIILKIHNLFENLQKNN